MLRECLVSYMTHVQKGDNFSYSVLELPEKDWKVSESLGFLQILNHPIVM